MAYHLILHYENERVYGYNISGRNLMHLRIDGSFMTTDNGGFSISNICFEGSEYKVVNKAFSNDSDQEYSIDGKKTDRKTAKTYFDDWFENTPDVVWVKIEE